SSWPWLTAAWETAIRHGCGSIGPCSGWTGTSRTTPSCAAFARRWKPYWPTRAGADGTLRRARHGGRGFAENGKKVYESPLPAALERGDGPQVPAGRSPMAIQQTSSVLRHLRRAALGQDGGPLTDGQLLRSFLTRHDEAAFEALVRRHGPMVLGVCRRVLGHAH